ncbi:hypothetical protein [Desulfovibrio sp. Huiquan2017]|uniref:hypothetical protein n=1 Tax=Desulfovibrio sp. Huiquan2017 TaxID=2816861 RepID=UPI001A90E824|nr:hypothetical protein [Desulfovibrio sp. Huiquan2017]
MRLSYFCGLGLILLLAIGTGWLSGGGPFFLDIPSSLVVAGTCLGALICNFGFRGSISAIASLILIDKMHAAGFRKSAAKTVMLSALFSGLFYLILGVISALGDVSDLSHLGRSLATGFISMLYGSFLALLVVPAYVSEE